MLFRSYLDALKNLRLRADQIDISTANGFELTIRGNWYQTILFEVPLLAIINEIYFRHTQPDAPTRDPAGQDRLREKIALLRDNPHPKINLIEFGTRRRYSREWQRTVTETLKKGAAHALIGTSNVLACKDLGLKPYGTMAHEYLQACQVFAPLPEFQRYALETWMQEYRGDLGIALSDVVGMTAFLGDFDKLFCKAYDGARHDSGDPKEWGDALIAHYKKMGVDPRVKSGVFSDGLDIPTVLDLVRYFDGRLHTMYGVGTNLTNDFSFKALNIVIKMTQCNGRPVAKLSDSPGKTMCKDEVYLAYLREAFGIVAA